MKLSLLQAPFLCCDNSFKNLALIYKHVEGENDFFFKCIYLLIEQIDFFNTCLGHLNFLVPDCSLLLVLFALF